MAAAGGGVYATGIKEVDRLLEGLPRSLAAKGARKGTRRAARLALEHALALVPVLTGALEMSLKVRAMKRSRRKDRQFDVGHSVLTGEGLFQGDEFYGGFLELGTGPRFTKSGKFTGLIAGAAFSYLRRAIYTDQAALFRAYVAEVQTWLRSIGRAG